MSIHQVRGADNVRATLQVYIYILLVCVSVIYVHCLKMCDAVTAYSTKPNNGDLDIFFGQWNLVVYGSYFRYKVVVTVITDF